MMAPVPETGPALFRLDLLCSALTGVVGPDLQAQVRI